MVIPQPPRRARPPLRRPAATTALLLAGGMLVGVGPTGAATGAGAAGTAATSRSTVDFPDPEQRTHVFVRPRVVSGVFRARLVHEDTRRPVRATVRFRASWRQGGATGAYVRGRARSDARGRIAWRIPQARRMVFVSGSWIDGRGRDRAYAPLCRDGRGEPWGACGAG